MQRVPGVQNSPPAVRTHPSDRFPLSTCLRSTTHDTGTAGTRGGADRRGSPRSDPAIFWAVCSPEGLRAARRFARGVRSSRPNA